MPNGGYRISLAVLLGDDVDVYLRLQGAAGDPWQEQERQGHRRGGDLP